MAFDMGDGGMTDTGLDSKRARPEMPKRTHRALLLIALFVAELVLLALAYQFLATIDCSATDAETTCRGLRSLVARALAVFAVAVVLLWARPGLASRFERLARRHPAPGQWTALHLGGVALLLVPLFVAAGTDMAPMFGRLLPFWLAGSAAAAVGAILWLAPLPVWRKAAGKDAPVVVGAFAGALVLPDLADLVLPLWWHWPQLTAMTFHAVAGLLELIGAPVYEDAAGYILGAGDFYVHIAHQCSGVEGLALVTGFTLLYAALFRDQIRVPHYWLVVLPLGLLLSWALNVLRIAVLIVIGDLVSPDLAVNGFHSYAGWLFFILLALGLMWFVHSTPWLHRTPAERPAPPPLRQDWDAARILPFVVFMLVSTVAAAFFFHPELGYPLKAAVMAGALAWFLPAYRGRDWRPTAPALMVGVAVGAFWIVAAPEDNMDAFVVSQLLTGLSETALILWIVCRVVGTVALVPLIEELFFRGYILARLDRGGMGWRIVALAVSSALFGLMHGRWWEAALAGLVFGTMALWRGRLADAVWAHVAANAVVAALALWRGDWALI